MCISDSLGQARAFDELHREEVRPLFDAELVDGNDVRMTEGDGRLRFLDETTDEVGVERELVADLLYDQLFLEAPGPAQSREQHPGHASPGELAFEHVLSEDLGVHSGLDQAPGVARNVPFAATPAWFGILPVSDFRGSRSVSYTHLRAHE